MLSLVQTYKKLPTWAIWKADASAGAAARFEAVDCTALPADVLPTAPPGSGWEHVLMVEDSSAVGAIDAAKLLDAEGLLA